MRRTGVTGFAETRTRSLRDLLSPRTPGKRGVPRKKPGSTPTRLPSARPGHDVGVWGPTHCSPSVGRDGILLDRPTVRDSVYWKYGIPTLSTVIYRYEYYISGRVLHGTGTTSAGPRSQDRSGRSPGPRPPSTGTKGPPTPHFLCHPGPSGSYRDGTVVTGEGPGA